MDKDLALRIIRENTFVTVGCTDVVAVALASARAVRELGEEPRSIEVTLDKNIYKNAIAVGIPGTRRSGLKLAVALGAVMGDPGRGLAIISGVTEADIARAEDFAARREIRFSLNPEAQGIYVRAVARGASGAEASALLVNSHCEFAEAGRGGAGAAPRGKAAERKTPSALFMHLDAVSLEEILRCVEAFAFDEIGFLLEGVTMNLAAAEGGEWAGAGLGLGAAYGALPAFSDVRESVLFEVKAKAAAAADARMAGLDVPLTGVFGSGNHGIVLFITLGLFARRLKKSDEDLARALALAMLVIGAVKAKTGLLTPHCGCAVAVGFGVSAACAWLLGGGVREVGEAVNLMAANLTGMLCDGAKYGCALKLATAAQVSVENGFLAASGVAVPPGNGMVGRTFRETMENLRIITERGMAGVDRSVLDILLKSGQGGSPVRS